MTVKDAITASTKTICRDITAPEPVGSQCNAILRRERFPSLARSVVSLPCNDCRLSGAQRTLRGHAVSVVIDRSATFIVADSGSISA
jgi:hypothetical protein